MIQEKQVLRLTISLMLLAFCNCLSQLANYPVMNSIKSGDHKLLTSTRLGPTSLSYVQPFFITFAHSPLVAIGIRDMQIASSSSGAVNYQIVISHVNSTNFTSTLTISDTNTYNLLYYMYIGIDIQAVSYTYLSLYTVTTTNQFPDSTTTKTFPQTITQTITNYLDAVITPLVVSFAMTTSHQFSFTVTADMTNTTTYDLKITSNSNLSRIDLAVIVVDVTSYQKNYTYFLDSGSYLTNASGVLPTSTFNPPSFNYYNYILGLTSFRIPSASDINFQMWTNNTFVTTTKFLLLQYSIVHFRYRVCTNSSIPKFVPQLYCYDQCPTGYATNSTADYCVSCSYTCATCQIDGTTCITCPINSSRTFNGTNCPCDTGYYDITTPTCSPCSYICLTCTNNDTNCLSCDSTRNLTANCACKTYFFQVNATACPACHYSCLTCSTISTNCTSCDNSTFRLLYSNTCPCQSGYQDNGTTQCQVSPLICAPPCVTCSGTNTTCTSCPINRTLTSGSCPCSTGLTSTSSTATCTEICGTGLLPNTTTKQCDDGNSLSGDGCSNICTIQSGFTCSNVPSTCISQTGYTVASQSLSKDTTSNIVTAILTINPIPPANTVPSLTSLQNSLSLQSYSLDRQTLTLHMNLLQPIDTNSQLSISLSVINQKAAFTLSSSNNLQLIPYTQSYFTLYNVQIILIWVYITLLWVLSIYRIITEPQLISHVTQTFVYSSLVWIGVEGQSNPMLLFQPLLNLKYIFGYNIQLTNSNSLLSVFNIGFGYLLLPLIIFGILQIISKKKPGTIPNRIKRFVLYDLTFAWLVINGFLIAYGLSLIVTTSLEITGLTIGGVIIAVLYILLMAIVSYRSFFKSTSFQEMNPVLQNTKKNLFKQRAYPIYLLATILISFIYIIIQNFTKINPAIMIVYYLALILIFGFGNIYINKLRNILNLLSLVLVYISYLLINYVTSATWAGFIIIGLIYLQLGANFTLMHYEKKNLKIDPESDQFKQMVKAQMNFEDPQENNNNQEHSDRGAVIELADHNGEFIIYEPQTPQNKKLEIIIPNPHYEGIELNAISSIKQTEIKIERQKISDLKQNLLTSPRLNTLRESLKKQEEFIDLTKNQVDMSQF